MSFCANCLSFQYGEIERKLLFKNLLPGEKFFSLALVSVVRFAGKLDFHKRRLQFLSCQVDQDGELLGNEMAQIIIVY